MFIKQGSAVAFMKSHPMAAKVGIVRGLALCDISHQCLLRIQVFDDDGQFVEVYAEPRQVKAFRAADDKTMQRHAEHRQSLRDRAMA